MAHDGVHEAVNAYSMCKLIIQLMFVLIILAGDDDDDAGSDVSELSHWSEVPAINCLGSGSELSDWDDLDNDGDGLIPAVPFPFKGSPSKEALITGKSPSVICRFQSTSNFRAQDPHIIGDT